MKMSTDTINRNTYGKRLRDRTSLTKPARFSGEVSLSSSQEEEILRTPELSDSQNTENSMPTLKKIKMAPRGNIMKEIIPDTSDSERADSDAENVVPNMVNDYEALVQRNIQQKLAFLQALNIPQAKQQLVDSLPKKPVSRGITIKVRSPVTPPGPRRLSNRLKKLEPDGEPLKEEVDLKFKPYQYPNVSDVYRNYTPRMPTTSTLGLKSTLKSTDLDMVEQFLNGLSGDLAPRNNKADIVYDGNTLSSMENREELVAKVVPDRIYSLAVHAGITDRRLIAAGGRTGYLGLWDIGSSEGEDGVFLFRPCHDSINCMAFEGDALLCCSYEGTLKSLSLRTGEFQHLYATPDNVHTRCTHFDMLSDKCYLISDNAGSVLTVDTRTPGTDCEKDLVCHEKPVKTVSVHPLQKNYFLTASNDGTARLWDLRCHKKLKPIGEVREGRSVNCAYFSPLTGNSFMTLSYNDTVKVYNSSSLGPDLRKTVSVRHDNQVGRWVTPFRGHWLPNSDRYFAAGSKDQPRQVIIYDAVTGGKQHIFKSDYLGSIVSIIACHPKIPLLAAGNSSGRVYVFQN